VALKADVLRSRTVDNVKKELAARMVALNVLRYIMLEAAVQHEMDPLRVSFSHAVRAVVLAGGEPARRLGCRVCASDSRPSLSRARRIPR
jgi:hypothetical protein